MLNIATQCPNQILIESSQEKHILCTCVSVQFSSVAQSYPTLCDPMNRSTPGLPVHHQLPEFTQTMSIESVMPSNHLIFCHPLLLPPSIFPSIRVFSNESALRIRWPRCLLQHYLHQPGLRRKLNVHSQMNG